jgi:dipeptidyl-peptidase-4
LVLAACRAAGPSGPPTPTFDQLLGARPINWHGSWNAGLRWDAAGGRYLERRDGVLQGVDPRTDAATPMYDVAAFEELLQAAANLEPGAVRRLARHPTRHSPDYQTLVVEHENRLYYYRAGEPAVRQLTEVQAERDELTLSPNGTYVAFRRAHDLYAIATATGQEVRLTQDGSDLLLNGKLDWVYQEEIYGRGNWRAYWWSEDGESLAYLQLDTTAEPVYPVTDYLPTHPETTDLRFPKAGDPNAQVRLGVVPARGGATVWADLATYADVDILIVGVQWAPDGGLLFAVQDRESRWLDLNEADPRTGRVHCLLHEDTPAWVDYEGPPTFLQDGTFLWFSSRDGWKHLYHYRRDGELLRQVTSGTGEARELHGVDEARGAVYLTGTFDSPVEAHLYRVPLAGGAVVRLTQPGFSHNVEVDPQFGYFLDSFSSVTTPTRVYVRDIEGELVRVISANEVAELRDYRVSLPEMVRLPTPDGYDLNAVLYRPLDVEPWRTYPVMCLVYGGPRMPSAQNRFAWEFGFHQYLAQQGMYVWICDPHSASGEGAVSAWRCYQQLGRTEVADLEHSLRWLAEHEPVDLGRVGIYGHSYGGYFAAYALTHSTMFAMGIAASALTDWRNYDSVYTEKYMRTPQHNHDGYERASVVTAAADLRGRLLIAHGVVDDNVHLQNALQFVDALLRHGQTFELLLFPRDDHGLWHYAPAWQAAKLEFIRRHLGAPGDSQAHGTGASVP